MGTGALTGSSLRPICGVYDALGRLVENFQLANGTCSLSQTPTTSTQFVFSPAGEKLAVFQNGLLNGSLAKSTVPLPGGETAVYNASGLSFIRHKDWLGSSRLATTWGHTVYSRESYAPFGETYNEAGTPDRSFTGQDQDTVTGSAATGVYDFLFRKYDPAAGRWISPDPSGWKAVNQEYPQSLNRYAYVQNNPMSLTDPNGLVCISGGSFDNSYNGPANGCNGTFVEGYIGDGGMSYGEAANLADSRAAYQDTQAQQQSTALGNGSGTAGAAGTPASARQGTPTTYSNPTWIKSGACPNGCWFAGQIIPYTLVTSAGKPVKITGNIAENIEFIIASANSDDRTGGGHMQNQSGFVDNVGLILGYNRIAGPDNPGYSYLKTSQTFTFTPDGGGLSSLITKITQMIISTSSGSIRVGTQVVVP